MTELPGHSLQSVGLTSHPTASRLDMAGKWVNLVKCSVFIKKSEGKGIRLIECLRACVGFNEHAFNSSRLILLLKWILTRKMSELVACECAQPFKYKIWLSVGAYLVFGTPFRKSELFWIILVFLQWREMIFGSVPLFGKSLNSILNSCHFSVFIVTPLSPVITS